MSRERKKVRGNVSHPVPRRCAAKGCSNLFIPKRSNHRFCSHNCCQRQWQRDKHERRTLESKRYDQCPRGHDRSPENVRIFKRPSGSRQLRCKVCMTENVRAWRARQKEAA